MNGLYGGIPVPESETGDANSIVIFSVSGTSKGTLGFVFTPVVPPI